MTPSQFSRQNRRKAMAAGGLADHLAANPLSQQVAADPRRQAMQHRRRRATNAPRTIENVFGLSAASQQNPLVNGARIANARANQIQSRMANAATMGQQAASSQGHTDNFGITTRRGVGNAGPSMGNQSAIDAAYAQRAARRAAKPTARIGKGADGKPMVAQGVTMDQLFPSASDAGSRAKFEAAQSARAERKAEARSMRQDQLAQRRQAAIAQQSQTPVINPFMNPIALEAMRRDPTLALGAVNNLNESLQGRSRLDQIASQAQQQNALANKRFTLDDFVQRAGVDNQGQMTTAQIADMTARQGVAKDSLGLRRDELALRYGEMQNEFANRDRMTEEAIQAGQYQRSPDYLNHQLKLAGRETGSSDASLTPAESFQASMAFSSQDPDNQANAIDWGANAIRQNPERAGEISQMVGASDEALLQKYEEAFQSPHWLFEDDNAGEMQKARIERIGLMLDARGIPRPNHDRQLPWLQEFLGWSYAQPKHTGRTLEDLMSASRE